MTLKRVSAPRPSPAYLWSEPCLVRNPIIIVAVIAIIILVVRGSGFRKREEK